MAPKHLNMFQSRVLSLASTSLPTAHTINGHTPTTGLRLIRIDRSPYGELQIPKDEFLELFDALNLEPYTLYMLQRESYGFQCFKSTNPSGHAVDTYYIKTISLLLVWLHKASTGWTEGILIPRISDSVFDKNVIFDRFAKTLLAHRDIVGRP